MFKDFFNIFNRSIHFDMNQFVINTNLYKLTSCPYYICLQILLNIVIFKLKTLSITSKKKKKADIYLDEARIGSLPESLRHNVGLLPLLPSDWY